MNLTLTNYTCFCFGTWTLIIATNVVQFDRWHCSSRLHTVLLVPSSVHPWNLLNFLEHLRHHDGSEHICGLRSDGLHWGFQLAFQCHNHQWHWIHSFVGFLVDFGPVAQRWMLAEQPREQHLHFWNENNKILKRFELTNQLKVLLQALGTYVSGKGWPPTLKLHIKIDAIDNTLKMTNMIYNFFVDRTQTRTNLKSWPSTHFIVLWSWWNAQLIFNSMEIMAMNMFYLHSS